jgi:hypothetical protein
MVELLIDIDTLFGDVVCAFRASLHEEVQKVGLTVHLTFLLKHVLLSG